MPFGRVNMKISEDLAIQTFLEFDIRSLHLHFARLDLAVRFLTHPHSDLFKSENRHNYFYLYFAQKVPRIMDATWDKADWKPTMASQFVEKKAPEPVALDKLIVELVKCSKGIKNLPYDPTSWKARGNVLYQLLFPELAISDAYKGILLCNAVIDNEVRCKDVLLHFGIATWLKKVNKKGQTTAPALDEVLGNNEYQTWLKAEKSKPGYEDRILNSLRGHRKDSYIAMIDALVDLDATREGLKICDEALRKYPKNKDFISYRDGFVATYSMVSLAAKQQNPPALHLFLTLDMGAVSMQNYPWIPKDLLERSSDVFTTCNNDLAKRSDVLEIKSSGLGDYGMFAKRDIQRGDKLLSRQCPINISSKQLSLPVEEAECFNCCQPIRVGGAPCAIECCPTVFYCSTSCQLIAKAYYHQALHGKDYSQMYKASYGAKGLDHSPEFTKLVFLRMLATCVQGGSHPLKNPLFAGLLPATGRAIWSLEGNVIGPNKILEDFGIDIFANADYDAWVLNQLWNRRTRNSARNEDTDIVARCLLDTIYSFFNHSCQVPCMVSVDDRKRNPDAFLAMVDIKEGQEVFNSYLPAPALGALNKSQRQEMLGEILDGPCKCTRCRSESR